MAFDLSSVMNQANEVAQYSSGDQKDKLRLIYPGYGTLKIKLLYNPKSNLVSRQIKRHKIGNTNYTCLGMYNMDCPICKTVESIKNATGTDMWKLNPKFRGISYAQYVGSDRYTWDNDNPEPQVGELILLMYPWTVYQDINRLISTAGVNASQVIASNKGKIINISRWQENSQIKYKGEIDGFGEFTSFSGPDGDAQFEKFLNELPDLNEAVVPATANSDIHKLCNDAAETLSREYLKGTGYNGMSTQMNQMPNNMSGSANIITGSDGKQYALVNGQYVPISIPTPATPMMNPQMSTSNNSMNPPTSVNNEVPWDQGVSSTTVPNNPTSSVSTTPTSGVTSADGSKMPECFGQHKDNDPKCMSCVYEIQCMTMK